MSNRSFLAWVVVLAIIIIVLIYLSQWQRWTGLTGDPHSRVIGHYTSLEACQIEVSKIGGWCGKGCAEYPGGAIAECKPIIKVEKLNQ